MAAFGTEPKGVDVAFAALRKRMREVDLPASAVQIGVMKMHRTPLLGRIAPAIQFAAVVVIGDGKARGSVKPGVASTMRARGDLAVENCARAVAVRVLSAPGRGH